MDPQAVAGSQSGHGSDGQSLAITGDFSLNTRSIKIERRTSIRGSKPDGEEQHKAQR
jgi:hypothetical protein